MSVREITVLHISDSVALRGDEAIITFAKYLWDCKENQLVAQSQCGYKWWQQMSHRGCQGAVTAEGSTELSASRRTVCVFVVFTYLLVYLLCSRDSHYILKLGQKENTACPTAAICSHFLPPSFFPWFQS